MAVSGDIWVGALGAAADGGQVEAKTLHMPQCTGQSPMTKSHVILDVSSA